jgi:hypothetical protein
MEPKVLKTNELQLSAFLLHKTRIDLFHTQSLSDDEKEISKEEEKPKTPHLAFLRVELTRLRAGMSDFLFKVSAPGPTPGSKPTVVTLRGDRNFAKLEGCLSASKVVFREMKKRKDETYDWDKADPDYLAKMLVNGCKYFVLNVNTDTLSFTTDAIH